MKESVYWRMRMKLLLLDQILSKMFEALDKKELITFDSLWREAKQLKDEIEKLSEDLYK